MASKLNTSTPRKRTVFPPEPLRESHDALKKSRITLERQYNFPSPLGKNAPGFICDCNPPDPIPTPLFSPGRGKPAGSKRVLKNGR